MTIQTDQLSIRNGAEVSANTSGIGNGGNLLIQATDRVEVTGAIVRRDGTERSSFLGSEVFPRGVNTPVSPEQITGKGGSLTIHTGELSIREGGSVSVSTFAAGDAGNILIQADELEVLSRSPQNTPSSLSANVGVGATGRGGTVSIEAAQLNVRNGGRISASTSGTGSAGSILVQGANSVILDNGSISTAVNVGAAAEQPSNITLKTDRLSLTNGAQITASTSGQGNAGNITIRDANAVNLDRSTISSTVNLEAIGNGGNITLQTDRLNLDRANITASTQGQGRAGNITVRDANAIDLSRSTISTAVQPGVRGRGVRGRGGNINLTSDTFNLENARITARTAAPARAGNITINASDSIAANNSTIETHSNNSSSGNVAIAAGTVQLQGNSDIRTQVDRGEGKGGNIALTANSVVAFDDSDIVTSAPEGQGGNITFNTAAFFGDGYQPDTPETESSNDRVDVDASGVQSGIITTPDVSFIQNSLAALSDNATSPETLLANSCIVRDRQQGRFTVTGAGGLPERPGNASQSTYPTGTIQSVPDSESRGDRSWQMGDAIVEPQGVYRLSDGRLVMGRECSTTGS